MTVVALGGRGNLLTVRQRGVAQISPLHGDVQLGDGLEAWHTRGHTPGVMSYCWHNPNDGLRYLFTGDTFNQATFDRVGAIFTCHPYEDNAKDLGQTLLRLRDADAMFSCPESDGATSTPTAGALSNDTPCSTT